MLEREAIWPCYPIHLLALLIATTEQNELEQG